jgi:hypothetical protein
MLAALMWICGAAGVVGSIIACGPDLTFRAYLKRSFWTPIYYRVQTMAPPNHREESGPYAGYLLAPASPALERLRAAYRNLQGPSISTISDVESLNQAVQKALAPGVLRGEELEEARLIECKTALRLGEGSAERLAEAHRKFESFLAAAQNPAFVSEGRGWLGRVHYLEGDYVAATRIYLDELDSPTSSLSREVLVNSLKLSCRAGMGQLSSRLGEFFDTPRHALFAVNLVTNPESETYGNSADGRKLLQMLQDHGALFRSGPDSEALVMALMRASLYLGDPAATLNYGAKVRSGNLRGNPEFNWMLAISHFVKRDYAAAEMPLLRMFHSASATAADRRTAAQALTGVYFKMGRKVDALHAAFLQASEAEADPFSSESCRPQWCDWCESLDLPYLLDAQLGEQDLSDYLKTFPRPIGPPISVFGWNGRKFSAPQIVQYSLAVRYARREAYAEAASLYRSLGIGRRAQRMHAAAALLARTREPSLSTNERLKARYEYGVFLAANPDRLYFNDLLWMGFQTYVFIDGRGRWGNEESRDGLTARERKELKRSDRKLSDDQEERWKSFHVLEAVAREAGHSELGRKAAVQLLDALVKINTNRFGREEEIESAVSTWKRWLRSGISTSGRS